MDNGCIKNYFCYMKKTFTSIKITLGVSILIGLSAQSQNSNWFSDATSSIGLSGIQPGSIISLDVNNDNYPDLITLSGDSAWGLYINTQRPATTNPTDRIMVDATANSGINLVGLRKELGSAGDFNNDGNVDLLVNSWYHDMVINSAGTGCITNPDDGSKKVMRIFLGDGHGKFTLKSNTGLEALGPMSCVGMPTFDFDKDGNLDVFIGNHYTNWCGVPFGNFIMKGDGAGNFSNTTSSTGINSNIKPLFGVNIADWNNDCNQDILTAPYLTTGYGNLWKNNGNNTFSDVGTSAGYNVHWMAGDNGQAMVPWAAMPSDYDNDGDIDFLVLQVHGGTATTEGRTSIFTNQGAANNYSLSVDMNRITRKAPMSTHHGDHNGWWLDFDNDGWQDMIIGDAVYMPSSDRMYFLKQDSSHNFIDITKELGFVGVGVTSIANIIRSPSVMISMDYDMDGDEDIFKCPYGNYPFLVLENKIANSNNFIQIKLDAPSGVNKNCIGARVQVKANGTKQLKEVYGSMGSFTNQGPFILTFGIGGATTVDSILVRWPDGSCSETVVTNVNANQFLNIGQQGVVNSINESTSNNIHNEKIELYPNPANTSLSITIPDSYKNGVVEIYNVLGEKIMEYNNMLTNNISVPVNHLSNGTYFVYVKSDNKILNGRFIKTN